MAEPEKIDLSKLVWSEKKIYSSKVVLHSFWTVRVHIQPKNQRILLQEAKMKMNVGRSDPPPRDKMGEGEDGGNGKEVKKIKSYSDVMKMKLDK